MGHILVDYVIRYRALIKIILNRDLIFIVVF